MARSPGLPFPVSDLLPLQSARALRSNGTRALSPPTLPEELAVLGLYGGSARVTAVARPRRPRLAGGARLVSEGRNYKGGNLVAPRAKLPGCLPCAPQCSWVILRPQPGSEARGAPVTPPSVPCKYLKSLPCHPMASLFEALVSPWPKWDYGSSSQQSRLHFPISTKHNILSRSSAPSRSTPISSLCRFLLPSRSEPIPPTSVLTPCSASHSVSVVLQLNPTLNFVFLFNL